jgi:ATP-dependent DNA ligase
VLDGELVVPYGSASSFDRLLQRIHPAPSRIARLSRETPARYLAFDLLAGAGGSLLAAPLAERRAALDHFFEDVVGDAREAPTVGASVPGLVLSPATTVLATARRWLARPGAGRDGVIAKRLDAPYRAGERTAMVKVKLRRTADCVVGGFRYGARGRLVGSLLLGLYGPDGLLHHVGFTSGLAARDKPALTTQLEALREPPGFTGKAPGGPSRWSKREDAAWEPLRPELVVEVEYDHFDEGRFRHGTRIVRWRPDKAAAQCTFAQLAHEAEDA